MDPTLFSPAPCSTLTRPEARLHALASRAAALTCAGIRCDLSAAFLRIAAGSLCRNPEGVRESLARRVRETDDPRFAALRALYAEALGVVGGAL